MNIISKTKIIATIGPSSWNKNILTQMIRSGMSIARVNASFADSDEIIRVSKTIRDISPRVALMIDTQGSKIRVTNIQQDTKITGEVVISSNLADSIQISYPDVASDVQPKDRILLDDGNIELEVVKVEQERVFCITTQEGILKPNKTVTIPAINLKLPVITQKDKDAISTAIANGYDFISLSFVRNRQDILEVKNLVGNSDIKIIAKIENKQGVDNFDEILQESDGVMIARGDLGVELPFEKVPIIQKQLIYRCRNVGKPVIVATQMLESMRGNTKPTRAEVSDVANAVMDGTDSLMLSAETSTGKHPVACVETMSKIAKEVEGVMQTSKVYGHTQAQEEVDELCRNTCDIAESTSLAGIIVISNTGNTLSSISRHRPNLPIWSISNSIQRMRHENILFGVESFYIKDFPTDRDEIVEKAIDIVFSRGELDLNDKIAIISGSSIRHSGEDATLEIVTVKNVLSR